MGLVAVAALFFGCIPWLLHTHAGTFFSWSGGSGQWLGVWLILNGAGLAGWCTKLLVKEGQGTPFPWRSPRRFVAIGAYQYVRNPMFLGWFLVLAGLVFLMPSTGVLFYGLLMTGLGWAWVLFREERQLLRRYGPLYVSYKRQVPRWVPRPPRKPLDL